MATGDTLIMEKLKQKDMNQMFHGEQDNYCQQ